MKFPALYVEKDEDYCAFCYFYSIYKFVEWWIVTRSYPGATTVDPMFIKGNSYNFNETLLELRQNELKCSGGYTGDVMQFTYNNVKITGKFNVKARYAYTENDGSDYQQDLDLHVMDDF